MTTPAKLSNEVGQEVAKAYLSPELSAARLVTAYNNDETLGLLEAVNVLHVKAVQADDLSQAEAMLICQAHALQAIFVSLAERAKAQTNPHYTQTPF